VHLDEILRWLALLKTVTHPSIENLYFTRIKNPVANQAENNLINLTIIERSQYTQHSEEEIHDNISNIYNNTF